ncbi:hypothetical protein GPM19_10215 [Halomonas sp. ZH2S]|uniref:Uncharacterized protein n=1 Tax=Vreelandella zhuhanensis TaxID=2684210 RepID=A0A7X3KQK0_9GAMM|nr:hypothetical protein [Halomonas zhuhanensis]MWJ28575.1 hypothetical protein [Halomonas zhuhanensis]
MGDAIVPKATRSSVRRYLYAQVLRLLREGWLQADEEKRPRNQRYHVLKKPTQLNVQLKCPPKGLLPEKPSIATPCITETDREHLTQLMQALKREIEAHESERYIYDTYGRFSDVQRLILPLNHLAARQESSLKGKIRALEKISSLLS